MSPLLQACEGLYCLGCGGSIKVDILRSPGGWYVGSRCPECGPRERLSRETHRSQGDAITALNGGTWIPREVIPFRQENP